MLRVSSNKERILLGQSNLVEDHVVNIREYFIGMNSI